jgi:hypothetical protein
LLTVKVRGRCLLVVDLDVIIYVSVLAWSTRKNQTKEIEDKISEGLIELFIQRLKAVKVDIQVK